MLWIVEGDKTRRRKVFNSACSFACTQLTVNVHEQKVPVYLEMHCAWITHLCVVAKKGCSGTIALKKFRL